MKSKGRNFKRECRKPFVTRGPVSIYSPSVSNHTQNFPQLSVPRFKQYWLHPQLQGYDPWLGSDEPEQCNLLVNKIGSLMSSGPNQKQSNDGNFLGSQERNAFSPAGPEPGEWEARVTARTECIWKRVFHRGNRTRDGGNNQVLQKARSTWDKPHGSCTYLWILKFFF